MENVRGHLSMGFGNVLADLAEIGYDAEWQVIPAAAVGAPHKRDRVFIVAYASSECGNGGQRRNGATQFRKQGLQQQIGTSGANVAYPKSSTGRNAQPYGLQTVFEQTTEFRKSGGPSRAFGDWWKVEPDVGRVANGVSDRVDRLKGLGNAIVPQVAELVGALVVEHLEN